MSLSSSSRKQSAGRHHKVLVWFRKGKSVKRILQLSALLIVLAHLPLLFVSTRVVFVKVEDAASAAITSTSTGLTNQPLSKNENSNSKVKMRLRSVHSPNKSLVEGRANSTNANDVDDSRDGHGPVKSRNNTVISRSQVELSSNSAATFATSLFPTDASNNSTHQTLVKPIWKCSDDPESRTGTKLVFVHIFKTAGSSIRNFLRDYSRSCHAGYGTIVSCTSVDPNSLLQQKEWKRCKLKEAMDQKGRHYRGSNEVTNSLVRNYLDILAGHLRLGTLDHLRDEHDNPMNIRYVSFFRNAADRFVSGKVYTKRRELESNNLTRQDVIRNIKSHVHNDLSNGWYFSKSDNYLLTPLQSNKLVSSSNKNSTSMEIKTGLMMQNLVKYNVLVGMVERMSESMQLLSHVLGKRVASSALKQNERANSNKSPISTSSILTELEQDDPGFFQKLMEYVN